MAEKMPEGLTWSIAIPKCSACFTELLHIPPHVLYMSGSFRNPGQRSHASVRVGECHFRRRCSTSSIRADLHSFLPTDRERIKYGEEKPLGLFTAVEASSSDEPDVLYHALLSNTEKHNVEKPVGFLYLHCWQDDFLRLRAILAERTCIGFDLDDILLEFRRSTPEFSRQRRRMLSLMKRHHSIIGEKGSPHSWPISPCHRAIDSWLNSRGTYEGIFRPSLELKGGALDILLMVKDMGTKIVVITEGPQDAQERTVQSIGIEGYMDFLASNQDRRSVPQSPGTFRHFSGPRGIHW